MGKEKEWSKCGPGQFSHTVTPIANVTEKGSQSSCSPKRSRENGYWGLLGRTPQACKPCSCPALWPKKEPGYSNRDISGVLDRGSYASEAKGPGATPPWCTAYGRQDMAAVFTTRGRRLPFVRVIDVRWANRLPRTPAAGAGGKHTGNYQWSPVIKRIG